MVEPITKGNLTSSFLKFKVFHFSIFFAMPLKTNQNISRLADGMVLQSRQHVGQRANFLKF